MPSRGICRFGWLGRVEYTCARTLQETLVRQVHDGDSPNTLLLLEHPHVFTRGRLGRDEHLLTPDAELAAEGAAVHETDRGGQITYHGPGQLVAYPIINLREWDGSPLQYVRTLERIILQTVSDFGIEAHTEEGLTGVWTPGGKIAAIGVKISQGVAFHGLSINVNTDLSWYRHIVPCGIADRPVTSMAVELAEPVELEAVRYSLVYHFGRSMGLSMTDATAELLSILTMNATQ